MKKFTFTFPTYEALSQFTSQSKAINVSIVPKQHIITGLFCTEEIDRAINQYQAVSNFENASQMNRRAY
jgi:hypothetical protein